MIPFRTKGFPYFDKLQDIMPNASARGGNVFSAIHTAPPAPLNQTLDLDSILDEGAEDTASGVDTITNPMDIDEVGDTSTFTSVSAGKRKLSTITPDEDMTNIRPIASLKLATSSIISSEPARKKITDPSASITSASRSMPKSSQGSSSSVAPSSRLSRTKASSLKLTSAKLSPALLVHEMQGSITTLASAVRESGAVDPVAKLRKEAVHAVSVRDDGLSALDKLTIIEIFRMDYASVQTYLALLEHDEIRKQWLIKQLQG
jgi:hypothetical protein